MTRDPDLEVRLGWIGIASVIGFGALLLTGLVLHLLDPGGAASRGMLEAGLVTLMLSPAVRLTLAVVERVRRREWSFTVMALIVIVELALVMWRAATKLS
jgi:uncharacterized membrane protein